VISKEKVKMQREGGSFYFNYSKKKNLGKVRREKGTLDERPGGGETEKKNQASRHNWIKI